MIYPFNASEAFKLAISIEENGFKFYQEAAKKFTGRVADLFKLLAKEEESHRELFQKLLSAVPKEEVASVFDPNNEQDSYLKVMAGLHVFLEKDNAVTDVLSKVKTELEAVKLAMSFEKDTIVFFLQLKTATSGLKDQTAVDKLISEETKHLLKLADFIQTLK